MPPAVEEPIEEEPIVEQVPQVKEKKKRGSKPKNQMTNSTQLCRPPLAKNALEDDTITPQVRRSTRTKKINKIFNS